MLSLPAVAMRDYILDEAAAPKTTFGFELPFQNAHLFAKEGKKRSRHVAAFGVGKSFGMWQPACSQSGHLLLRQGASYVKRPLYVAMRSRTAYRPINTIN
jgi:hypothetical protein